MRARRPAFGLIAKLTLAMLGYVSIWVLRSYPLWFLAFTACTISVFAVDAIRSYRRTRAM
jgi:hypothetical protein